MKAIPTVPDESDDRRAIYKARNRTLNRFNMRREEAMSRAAVAIMEARAMDAAANAIANMTRSELDTIEHEIVKMI